MGMEGGRGHKQMASFMFIFIPPLFMNRCSVHIVGTSMTMTKPIDSVHVQIKYDCGYEPCNRVVCTRIYKNKGSAFWRINTERVQNSDGENCNVCPWSTFYFYSLVLRRPMTIQFAKNV